MAYSSRPVDLAAVNGFDEEPLDRHADSKEHGAGHQNGKERRQAERGGKDIVNEATQHIELAMGEVDDFQDTEYER